RRRFTPAPKRCLMTSIADQAAAPQIAGTTAAAAAGGPAARASAISLPAVGERELRLDLFRGLALWLIFIDHLPPSLLTWFTLRIYGFSDATEIFIFLSCFTAAFIFSSAFLTSGYVIA